MADGTSRAGRAKALATTRRSAHPSRIDGAEYHAPLGLTPAPPLDSVPAVTTHGELRIEPSPQVLDAARRWTEPVRTALGNDFLAAYLTGSVLLQGFDSQH